jgi:hypothetical protein
MNGQLLYSRALMDSGDATTRAVVFGHLTITIPAIVAIGVVVRWGLYQFGPLLWPYYVTGGIALASQWYSMALPRWKGLLTSNGLPASETEDVAQRSGLVWPGAEAIASLALHTTAAAICGIHFGPWLLSRWFVWILPLVGIAPDTPRADYWIQHLELVSVIPALVVGFVVSRYFEKLASWAWLLPTIILAYKLLTFTDPYTSVLASNSSSRFSYYFVTERSMPSFYNFAGTARFVAQITFVVPFYSGVAYSIGALMMRWKVMEKIIRSFRTEPEPEVFSPEEAGVEWIGDDKDRPAPEDKQVRSSL